MTTGRARHTVVSVSLPRDLVERANALIPRTRRSRVIAGVLTAFLDSIARRKLEQEYVAYYTKRSPRETREEQKLLAEWAPSDQEAWAILDRAERTDDRRPTR